MSVLKKQVVEDTMAEVQVHYLTRQISAWWNARRSPEDTATFCGWYWVRNREEGGPFRTRSAALRDAYYRFVIHQRLPIMWTDQIPRGMRVPRKKAVAKKKVSAKKKITRSHTAEVRAVP